MTSEEFYNITDPYELLSFIQDHNLQDEFEIDDICDIDDVDSFIDDWVRDEISNDYWYNIADTLSDIKSELDRDYDNYIIYGINHILPLADQDLNYLIERIGQYAEDNDLFDDSPEESDESFNEGVEEEELQNDPEEFQGEPITDSEFDEFASEFVVLTA